MTYKEKYMLDHPEMSIDDIESVVRYSCPKKEDICEIRRYDRLKCLNCWNAEIPDEKSTHTRPSGITNPEIDIHKIIDDAMEKKDRYVSIFFMNGHTSVYVYPLSEDGLRRWIRVNSKYSRCPNCGRQSEIETPYCCMCGENLGRSEGEE